MPLPLLVLVLKASATAGCACGALDLIYQVVERKILPKKEKRKPISSKHMIKAFAVGVVLGNVAGSIVYARYFHKAHAWQIIAAIGWTELVWSPMHIAVLSGNVDSIDQQLPRVFGYAVFTVAGGYLVCDMIVRFGVLKHAALRTTRHVEKAILMLGGSFVGFTLFAFCNKFADYQRNKTIKFPSSSVNLIQAFASNAGQVLGNVVAVDIIMAPWLPIAIAGSGWYFSAMIITPGFFYCTALNIENGVQSEQIHGRLPEDQQGRNEAQKRASIMQTLPLGALPSGFVKGRNVNPGVMIACKFLAAACASMYIAYQQTPWEKYRTCEISRYGRMADDNIDLLSPLKTPAPLPAEIPTEDDIEPFDE